MTIEKTIAPPIFELACGMETGMSDITILARTLMRLAEGLDDGDGSIIQFLAYKIEESAKGVEESRAKLFHLAHPHAHAHEGTS